MSSKDLFSNHAQVYATFRPTYPEELYHFIFKHLSDKSVTWDCGTGNGQAAQFLSQHFKEVFATDISQQQLDHAFRAANIFYSVSKAEHTTFKEKTFDLITVAQALHWINTDEFYREVKRTAKSNALLAVWGYGLLNIDPRVDGLIIDFYRNTVGKYWDSARKMVDEGYKNVPFPFETIETPDFAIKVSWTIDHLAGYLTSWSATQKYTTVNGRNPVPDFIDVLRKHWKEKVVKPVTFPIFMKLGRVTH